MHISLTFLVISSAAITLISSPPFYKFVLIIQERIIVLFVVWISPVHDEFVYV
jgi:hypothetical protein